MDYELLGKVEREVLGCTGYQQGERRRRPEPEQVSNSTNYTLPV
jgi:hypothetical protein